MVFVILALILGSTLYKDIFIKNSISHYKIAVERPNIGYTLDSKKGDEVTYISNHNAFTSVSIGTEYFDVGISVEGEGEAQESSFEKTEVFDAQFIGVYQKNILWDVYYQNYQGLYVVDFDDVSTLLNSYTANAYQYGFGFKYFSKKGYDVKKSLGHFSKEKESNWSWVHGISASQSSLKSSTGLTTNSSSQNVSEISGLKEIRLSTFGYEFGVSGMYAWEHFYLSGLFSLGTRAQHQSLHGLDDGLDDSRWLTAGSVSFIGDIGGKVKNHSFGLQLKLDSMNIPVKDVSFSQSRAVLGLYYNHYF